MLAQPKWQLHHAHLTASLLSVGRQCDCTAAPLLFCRRLPTLPPMLLLLLAQVDVAVTSGLNDVTVGGEVSYDAAKSAITKVTAMAGLGVVCCAMAAAPSVTNHQPSCQACCAWRWMLLYSSMHCLPGLRPR